MAQPEPGTNGQGSAPSGDAERNTRPASGAEAYAYDPRLRVEAQVGLDRLRCVEDREIAGLLFKLHQHLERRELAQSAVPRPSVVKTRSERWTQIALDALAGKHGTEARELAEYFLKGDDGRDHLDEGSLRAFARGYEKLRAAACGAETEASARGSARHRVR